MTVVALSLLIIPANGNRPATYIPFATEKACEEARHELVKHSRMLEPAYFCTWNGATKETKP